MSQIELRPGLADVPVAESAVSFIDGKNARLEYRGIAVETLATESCFEETTYLLLKGELPTQKQLADFDDQLRHHRRIKFRLTDLIKCLPETGHPMYALQAAVAAMGMFYPARDVTNAKSNWESTIRLVAKLPTVVAAFHRIRHGDEPIKPRDDLDHAANFYWMLFEKEPSPAIRKVIDACLILHAEHTMNASTFSGRVTGSTLGQPLHRHQRRHRHPHRPLARRRQRGSPRHARGDRRQPERPQLVRRRHRHQEKNHGLRPSRLQGQGSARHGPAEAWPNASSPTPANRPHYDLAVEMENAMAEKLGPKGIYPNVDFYSGIVYHALGIPRDLFTPIFAICAGGGLAQPLARTDAEQPHLSAGADLRRQAQCAVCAAGAAAVSCTGENVALTRAARFW